MTDEEFLEAMKLGELAYKAYCELADGWGGVQLPTFSELGPLLQRAWAFSATVVSIHQLGLMNERLQRI